MARYVAKHIVAAKFAEQCEVQLAFAIGQSHPVAISINTFGTNLVSESEILTKIQKVFDFSTQGMIQQLDLNSPIFGKTSVFGHFGREDFPWERLVKLDELCL